MTPTTPVCLYGGCLNWGENMNVVLMMNVSEPNKLDKVVSTIMTCNGALREESSISNPSILIEGNMSGSGISANYAHIPEFGRYYYINDITSYRNGLWRVDMHCDVLMSFKQAIKASVALYEEMSETGVDRVNNYISNDAFVSTVKNKTDVIQFPDGFNDSPYFILITAGGVVS